MNSIFRRFVIISILPLCASICNVFFCTAFFCTAFVCAQNSHIQDLIQQYKAQNPAAAEALQRKEQQRLHPEIKIASATPAVVNPVIVNPAEINPAEINLNAANPAVVNSDINPNQYRQLTSEAAMLPLFGNPLDPLNSRYDAQWNNVPNRRATPYDELLGDASLNDVFFINPQTGWAAGNHGVIWKTSDGGQNWRLQRSPLACTLYSVHFTDEHSGFAAGGYHFPYTNQGSGVILTTNDGGEHWTQVSLPNVPVLRCVRMSDPTKGIVAGESSELFPSGIFTTRDGGRTWQYSDSGKKEGWAALDFIDEKSGFGIGCFGSVQNFGQMNQSSVQLPVPDSVRFSQVKAVKSYAGQSNPVQAYLAGSNYIFSTSDNGTRWVSVAGRLPGSVASIIDLKTVECIGNDIWVAGNPGCCIYHSADAGRNWKAVQTNQNAAIKKIVFTDVKNGWAIGELGTILATKDGGNTWQKQHSGGSRLAVLGVFGTPDDIPLETFIQLCANQGYLGASLLLFRQQDDFRSRSFGEPQCSVIDTLNEGFIRTGANVLRELNRVPALRSELQTDLAQLDAYIKKQNDGKELEKIRELLVLTIRQMQPEILLASNTDQTAGGSTSARYSVKSPVQEFVLREIVLAVKSAADPTVYPYQITELGLNPWQVKKIHLALPKGVIGDVNIPLTEPLVRLGQPLDELAEVSYGLFETIKNTAKTAEENKEHPAILGYSTQLDVLPPNPNKDFFAGIEMHPGTDCRRAFAGSYADLWERIQQRIQQRRQVLGIIEQTANTAKRSGSSAFDVRLASNAEELTRKIDSDAAVQVLLKMSRQFSQSGDWESAVEANELLVRQHVLHPLSRSAYFFLVPHFGSSESYWSKINSGDSCSLTDISVQKRVIGEPSPVVPTLEKTVMVEQFLERSFPALAEEPPLRFAAASAARRLGWFNNAAAYYQKRGNKKYDDVWSMRARAEYWAAVPNKAELPPELQDCPLPVLLCSFSPDKPYLDGEFDRQYDNGTWFKSNLYSFTAAKHRSRLQEIFKDQSVAAGIKRENRTISESKNFGTQVMLMYDKEYLYIGFRCKKAAGFNYPPFSEKPRSRDTDLSQQDRIEILIDTDRDYSTYYTLTVDSRGWASDSCCGTSAWNPEYYIARNEDADYWYLETAIPLNSLTGQNPVPQSVWGIGLRRIVPGIGIECWNAENSFGLTEGLGFLMFE